MAPKSTAKLGGRAARVRLVVLDAEIPDGDIGSFKEVLQNALRGPMTTIVQQRINGASAGTKTLAHQPAPEDDVEVEETVDNIVDEEEDASSQPARQPRAKRSSPKTPKVIPIEMNASVSFADFVQGKDAKSQHKKYMIAAAWLKEHRETDAVTDSHIYTCFRSIGWPTNITDFGQPLRDLKARLQYFDKSEKGYEINHLGLDYVRALGGTNAAG